MFITEILQNITINTEGIIPMTSSPIVNAFIILAVFSVLAKAADFVFEKVFLKLTAHTQTKLDDDIVESLKSPIYYAVLVIGLYASTHSMALGEEVFSYTDNTIQTLLIIIGAVAAWRVSNNLIDGVVAKFAAKTKSTLDDEMVPLFKNISRIIIFFAAILFTLSAWDVNVTPFLASAGVVGIALAFAAQSTVANLFGGIAIYFDKPFKVGDRIQLETGEIGDVVEIGIRSARIRTFENALLVIPNDKIANSKIINFHQPFPKSNVRITIGVTYGSDVAKVRKTLLKVAHNCTAVLKDPAPEVYFTEHGGFALKFLLVAWIPDPTKKIIAINQINECIEHEFKKEKIEMAFPTQTIYLKK